MTKTSMTATLSLIAVLILTGCEITRPAPGYEPSATVRLNVPENAAERQYLGLTGTAGTFGFADIGADIVIVEILHPSCPYCRGAASLFNELYNRLEAANLEERVKMIGIAGATDFVVRTFKDKYDVPFPLFADPDNRKERTLEVRGVPYMAVFDLRSTPPQLLFEDKDATDMVPERVIKQIQDAL